MVKLTIIDEDHIEFFMECDTDDTIEEVKKKIGALVGKQSEGISLKIGDQVLQDHIKLEDLDTNSATVDMYIMFEFDDHLNR